MTPQQAIQVLRQLGLTVTPASIPGLYDVTGRVSDALTETNAELTERQLIDLAIRKLDTSIANTGTYNEAAQALGVDDQTIKIAVDDALQTLNKAISAAAMIGLKIEVSTLDTHFIARPHPTPIVTVQLSRPL